MKRDVYAPPPLPDELPADAARQKRRMAKRTGTYKRRADMPTDELAAVRAANMQRQKAYRMRKRIALGLPPVGRPGRPKKSAA